MYSKILASGSYLPEKILTNKDLEKLVDTSNEWIVSRTGIKQRHIAASDQTTSDLAYKASLNALSKTNLKPQDIDAIICATTTADYTFPSCATIIQNKLGSKTGFAFDIQAVCSGFLYALSLADSLIMSNKAKRVLVIGADTFTKLLNWQDRNTCVLFGDGAGCVILEQVKNNPEKKGNPGIIGIDLFSDGSYTKELQTTGGASTNKEIGHVVMNGAEVYKHAVTNLEKAANFVLEKYNISVNDVNFLIPHQANIRIIEATAKRLGISMEKVVLTVDKHANTSAASIPLALDSAFTNNKLKSGDLIMLESMGAGFTWGAGLVRI